MENLVIGIEGLVGSGKTSICRDLLHKIPNSILINGGNLYRGIVFALMNQNTEKEINLNTLSKNIKDIDILEIMKKLNVELKIEDRETVVHINDRKIDEDLLQSEKSSMSVSIAAKRVNNKNLYIFARNIINKWKKEYNIIVSGRDLMQIYPNLDYHFFITASLDERVNRKFNQYNGKINIKELKKHIQKRDELQEMSGFYKRYNNTIDIDVTQCKNSLESTKILLEYIKELSAIV